MRSLLILIRWIVGCLLCFSSIGGFMAGESGSAIFVLLFGLIIIPPITKLIFSSKKQGTSQAGKSESPEISKVTPAFPPAIAHPSDSKEIKGNIGISVNNVSAQYDKVNMSTSLPTYSINDKPVDNSILDITGEEAIIPNAAVNTVQNKSVVPWDHRYIYSKDELYQATEAQQDYYRYFKERFLQGDFPELGPYNNYAFILLFDLVEMSEKWKNIDWLEKQLDVLGNHYPRTYSYARNSLLTRMGEVQDYDGIRRIKLQMVEGNAYSSEYYWGLGRTFKDKLKLDSESEQLLNKIWYQGNNFYGIAFCQEQILKLFIQVIKCLQSVYSAEGTSIEQEFDTIGDLVARKQFRYRLNSNNYIYCLQSVRKELYILILKYCENAIRDHYEHKRKLSADSYAIAKEEIETRILGNVNNIIRDNINLVDPPNEETELELNAQNTYRWKSALAGISQVLPSKSAEWFLKEVLLMGANNRKNPSVENIFYESSKIIAKTDKTTALILYLHYIDHDLRSKEFDNKPIAKTIQKSLFKNAEQVQEFENLIQKLIDKRDLDSVIAQAREFYIPKRKKIQLDKELIDSTKSKYEDTVELLGNFFDEEEVAPTLATPAMEDQDQEIRIVLNKHVGVNEVEPEKSSGYRFALNPSQEALLQLFVKHNFVVAATDAQALAKSNGLFMGPLIESINDLHFEYLDDVLIEEEEDVFVINENYYKKIISNEHNN